MKTDSRVRGALILSLAAMTAVVVLLLILGSHSFRQLSAQPPPPWTQHPAQEDSTWRSQFGSTRGINYLSSMAPTFEKADFGPGTKAIHWRAPWVVTALFTKLNGLQYAIVTTSNHGGTGTFYELGTLVNGRFTRIAIPGTPMQSTIQFISSVAPDIPTIVVISLGRPPMFFALQGATAIPLQHVTGFLNYRDEPAQICQDFRGTASANAFALNGHPIVSKAELSAVTLGVADSQAAYVKCFRFASNDIVEVGSALGVSVTYRATKGRLTLLARGGADFTSPRYLLFRITESTKTTFTGGGGTEYQDYMQDYVEVFPL